MGRVAHKSFDSTKMTKVVIKLLSPGRRCGNSFIAMLPSDETTKTCGGRATRDDSLSSLSEETLTLRAVSPTDILPEKGVNVPDDSPKPQSKAPSSRDASKPSSFKRRPGDEFRSTSRSASFRPEFSYDPNVPQVYGTALLAHTTHNGTHLGMERTAMYDVLDLYLSRADRTTRTSRRRASARCPHRNSTRS